MKKLLYLLNILILASCGSNEKIENDWTKDKLKGKVMSYSEYLYFQNENGDIESRQEDHKKYDDKGNKVEESEYGSGGELIRRETNKYDEKGNS